MISDLHNVTTAQHDQFKCLQDTMELTNVEIITARHQVTRVTQVTRIPWGSVVLTLGLSTSSLGPGWFLFTVVTWCQCYDMSCQMSGSCQLDGSSNGLMLLHHTAPQYGLRFVNMAIEYQYSIFVLIFVCGLIVNCHINNSVRTIYNITMLLWAANHATSGKISILSQKSINQIIVI